METLKKICKGIEPGSNLIIVCPDDVYKAIDSEISEVFHCPPHKDANGFKNISFTGVEIKYIRDVDLSHSKEPKSCMYGIEHAITTRRRDGNTTRCVNNTIDMMFKGEMVILEDHPHHLKSKPSPRHLLEKILNRINQEYHINNDGIDISLLNGKTVISFKNPF